MEKKHFCQNISNPDKLVKVLIFKEKQCSYYYWTLYGLVNFSTHSGQVLHAIMTDGI